VRPARPLVFLILAGFAATASAAVITVDPVAPDSATPILLTIAGSSPESCAPDRVNVQQSRNTIDVWLSATRGYPPRGCPTSPMSWTQDVRLDPLTPGFWKIRSHFVYFDRLRGESETEIFVREANPRFVADPMVVPANTPGQQVRLGDFRNVDLCPASRCLNPVVTVGGIAVAARVGPEVVLDLPPMAPGPADVVIQTEGGTFTVRQAIVFYDPAAAVNESLFERFLVPVSLNANGAHGSVWRTDVSMMHPARVSTNLVPLTPGEPVELTDGAIPNDDRGFFIIVPRQRADDLVFSAFIRDVSREDDRFGTELPIVRQRDFRAGAIDFLNLPIGAKFRSALRIYALEKNIEGVSAYLTASDDISGGFSRVELQGSDDRDRPAYGIVSDLQRTDYPGRLPEGRYRLRISGPLSVRIWAMVTVTNNETQEVTIITPQ
jgi:hypothetical protein